MTKTPRNDQKPKTSTTPRKQKTNSGSNAFNRDIAMAVARRARKSQRS